MLSPALNHFPHYNRYLFPLPGRRGCKARRAEAGICPSEAALTYPHAGLHGGKSPLHKGAFFTLV